MFNWPVFFYPFFIFIKCSVKNGGTEENLMTYSCYSLFWFHKPIFKVGESDTRKQIHCPFYCPPPILSGAASGKSVRSFLL